MGTTCPLQSIPPPPALAATQGAPEPAAVLQGHRVGIWARTSKTFLGKIKNKNKKRKEQALFCAEPKFRYRPRMSCGAGEGTGAGWGGGSAPLGASRKMYPNFGQEPSRTLPGMAESPLQLLCPRPAAQFPLWMRFGAGAGASLPSEPPPPAMEAARRGKK